MLSAVPLPATDIPSTRPLVDPLEQLRLLNPEATDWPEQIVFVDFDGATGVEYNGPVGLSDLDVPAMDVPDDLGVTDQAVIDRAMANLDLIFDGYNLTFTTVEPAEGEYSTVYVGGTDAAFRPYSRNTGFWAIAEGIDVGNANLSDNAFVFTDDFPDFAESAEHYAEAVSYMIGREVGRLIGYADEHSAPEPGEQPTMDDLAMSKDWLKVNGATVDDGDWVDVPTSSYIWLEAKFSDWNAAWSQGGVNISLPYLEMEGGWYSSSSWTGNDGSSYFPDGSTIWHKNGYQIISSYDMVEGYEDGWSPYEAETLGVRVRTPSGVGDWFKFMSRGWEGSDFSSGSGTDQQGYSAYQVYVNPVAPADLRISDMDALNEPWTWGDTEKVDYSVTNYGGTQGTAWVKLIVSNDTTLWDADDHVIYDDEVTLNGGQTWSKSGRSVPLPSTPWSGYDWDDTLYVYAHIGDPFDDADYDSVSISPPPSPDLTRKSGASNISDTTLNPGQDVTINLTVQNIGNASANAGYVDYFWNKRSDSYDVGDRVGWDDYGALGAWGESPESFTFTVPTDASPGTYYLSYFVDSDNSTDPETRDDNNKFYWEVTVNSVPNLDISNFNIDTSSLQWGGQVQYDVSIYNSGNDTGEAYVKVMASDHSSNPWAGNYAILMDENVNLGAGSTWTRNDRTYDLPDNPSRGWSWATNSDTIYLYATIGTPFDDVSDPITKSISMPPAELHGDYFVVQDTSLDAGDSFDVHYRIANTGGATGDAFYVKFYVSPNNMISSLDERIGTVSIDAMDASSTTPTYSTNFTLPEMDDDFWLGDGTYYVGMVVDSENDVPNELDETNNASTGNYVDYNAVSVTVPSPHVTSIEWLDKDGNATTSVMNGQIAKVRVHGWRMDGQTVQIKIYEDDYDLLLDEHVDTLSVTIGSDGTGEAEWVAE